jgi:NO-binding membrane sensor protein with MHYT domain
MDNLQHFEYGLLTPMIAFVMASVGSGLGLRCVIRAVESSGVAKRGWLITAATAIGAGVWTMQLITMLGFAVEGSPLRFGVSMTLLSLVAALLGAGVGVCAIAYSRSRTQGIAVGGLSIGAGIVVMLYTGMSAMQIHGTMSFDPTAVAVAVLIAIGTVSIALMVAFNVPGARGTVVAALLMGAAAAGAQYVGTVGLRLDVHQGTSALPGASAVEFILPLTVVFGSFVFLCSAFVALSPGKQDQAVTGDAISEPNRAHELAS